MQYTVDELATLFRLYLATTKWTASGLSREITGGYDQAIGRLLKGEDANSRTTLVLSEWIDTNWPAAIVWPADVPRNNLAGPNPHVIPPRPQLGPAPRLGGRRRAA